MQKDIYMWHQNHYMGSRCSPCGVQFKELPVDFCLLLELPNRESNCIYIALVISLFVIVQ